MSRRDRSPRPTATTRRSNPVLRTFVAGVVLATSGIAAAPLFASMRSSASGGTITVELFHDYNANGVRNLVGDVTNPAVDRGVAGAGFQAVCLTDAGPDGVPGTGDGEQYAPPVLSTGGANGVYYMSNLAGTPCRVEATVVPDGYSPAPIGPDNAGLVQFTPSNVTVTMGVMVANRFCQDNPTLVTTCMTFGDQVNGANKTLPVVRSFPYAAKGSTWVAPFVDVAATPLATAQQVGTVFGTDYSRNHGRIYLSALTKVYAGYGPGGAGAIYTIDRASGAVTTFATIPNVGGVAARSGYAPNPNSVSGDWLQDGAAWNAVGAVGLGDIQLSEDESTLWVVNLNDRSLYPVDAATGTVGSPVSIPLATGASKACAPEMVRPFGLGAQGRELLVGSVCSGPDTADLHLYLYRFDPATAAFSATPVFETGLGYTRGRAGNNCGPTPANSNWLAWSTTNRFDGSTATPYCAYPQPMLSDIVVDDDGSLILGLRDRFGDQAGEDVPAGPNGGGGEGVSAGDLLRACPTGTGWAIENKGVCGGVTGVSTTNDDGPGGGEFYADGFATPNGNGNNHEEIGVGGLAKVPGFATVTHTVFDPTTVNGSDWRSGGVRTSSNSTGVVSHFYQLFDKCDSSGIACPTGRTKTLTFGKVNGVGDVVALCDKAPVEIGNRVWIDADGNGVQDPGEPGLPGTPVTLTVDGTQHVATTDAGGVYRFSSDARSTSSAESIFGIAELSAGKAVTITVPTTATVGGKVYPLTAANVAVTGVSDQVDSDADASGVIAVVVGGPGDNNHTFDAGYAPNYSLGNLVWDDLNNNGRHDDGEAGLPGVSVSLAVDRDGNGIADGAPLASQTTNEHGFYLFTSLTPSNYIVEVVTPAGYRSSTGRNGSPVGPYEGAQTPDPDTDEIDNDDSGSAVNADGTLVRSKPVTIGGTEPLNEPATLGLVDPASDDSSNLTVDFGFFRPMSVGNLVWDDADNSGTVSAGEVGLAGVTVHLIQAGETIATTSTDPNGRYLFTMLGAGDYEVEALAPSGYQTSTGNGTEPASDPDDDVEDHDDNGSLKLGVIRTESVTLSPGTEPELDDDDAPVDVVDPATDINANYTLDIGLWRPVSLGNLVWDDRNDDGVRQPTEPGLAGIRVCLFAADGVTQVTTGVDGMLGTADDGADCVTTGDAGNYGFSNLPGGSYVVAITVPADRRTSSIANAVTNDDVDNDNDGGERTITRAVSGVVELSAGNEPANDGDTDRSSNLSVDFGLFAPQAAMAVKLYTNGCDADTATAASGPAGGCPPGDGLSNPVVTVGSTVTWTYVARNTGTVVLTNATITEDRIDVASIDCNGAAAGNGQPFTLAVGASRTCTATGIAVAGQYANATTLTADGERTPASVATPLDPVSDPSHYFAAAPGLAIKTYTLLASPGDAPNGVLATPPAVTTTDDADLPGGNDSVANHVIPSGSSVWWTYAVTNSGNVALSNVVVTDDRAGAVCTLPTLAAGTTAWCVKPGSVAVGQTTNGQYGNVGSATGTDDITVPGTPAAVGPVSDPTHVFLPSPAIGIVKYTNDIDADTPPERPRLNTGDPVVWTYVVTNTGNWPLATIDIIDDREGAIACPSFPGGADALLPGMSMTCSRTGVVAVQPDGADYVNVGTVTGTPVPPSIGSLDKPTAFNPSGYTPVSAAIGDRVWEDANADGLQDADEPGVGGVVVRLVDVNGVEVARTTTDSAGEYRFSDLAPAVYGVAFEVPDGYAVSPRNRGAVDVDSDADPATGVTGLTSLDPAEVDPTWDLGIYRTASLGDYVWHDANVDGLQGDEEAPIAGVAVQLFDVAGAVVATVATDDSGAYRFDDLRPGTYVVAFTAPDSYAVTVRDADFDADDRDSDVDPASGQSHAVNLSSGEHDPTIDAGFHQLASIGSRVWIDANRNGLFDSGEPPVPGVLVTLFDGVGNAIATQFTDAQGRFLFSDLRPGPYSLGFSNLPDGMTLTNANQGGDPTIDSDADTTTGRTPVTTLTSGEIDLTWFAGIVEASDSALPTPTTNPPAPQTESNGGSSLPRTGASIARLVMLGGFGIMLGAAMVLAQQRRRPVV